MITLDEVETALAYLGETVNDYAMHKAHFLYQAQHIKTVRSLSFLEAPKGTVGDRTAYSETSEAYKAALQAYRDAAYEYERTRAKRQHAELQIELWRSQQASLRAGNIV